MPTVSEHELGNMPRHVSPEKEEDFLD